MRKIMPTCRVCQWRLSVLRQTSCSKDTHQNQTKNNVHSTTSIMIKCTLACCIKYIDMLHHANNNYRVDCIHICSPHVQVSSRVCICIRYWRALSGGRCRGSSATSFQFIFVTDCQPHPTVYRRWPSFSGCRCSRLEQSAWSCHFCTFRSCLLVSAQNPPV